MHAKDAAPHLDEAIARAAGRSDGPLDRAELTELGLRHGAIDHRVRTGRLQRVHNGVYVPGHVALTQRGHWQAALRVGGSDSGLSHATSGAVHDLRATASSVIHVTVRGDGGRKRRREDVVVHRSKVLLPRDLVEVDGLRVTSVAWTVRDLAARSSLASVVRLLERCELLRLFDRGAFLDVVARGRGRRGTARLREALELWTGEPVMTRSELEELVRSRIEGTALDQPVINGHVCGDEADFHWPALRVVLEVDGWETHRTRAAFERDRARDAKRQAAGWRTTRATYFQVRDSWADVEAAVLGGAARMA